MSPNHNPVSDEQLDRHIAALRDETVPADGPSPQAVDATLAMLKRSEQSERVVTGRRPFYERIVAMTMTQRIAAVVMLTLGALVLYAMFALFNTLAPSVAFADVAGKLKAARTLSFYNTMTLPGQPPVTTRMLMADPDRLRNEIPGGVISIISGQQVLVLDPAKRTAMRMDLTGGPTTRPADYSIVTVLRKLGDVRGEPLGEKKIDDVEARGFRTQVGSQTLTVWADAKTAMPVRVETIVPMGDAQAMVVMDRFQIDPPLDDELFSLEPPAGYTLTKQTLAAFAHDPEQAVIDLLRLYAEGSGGKFPARVDDVQAYTEVLKTTKATATTNPTANTIQLAAKLGAGFGAAYALAQRPGYGYAGDQVTLGEKDKLLLWYKPHAKSDKYRAIFGDLRIEDVTADKLPTTKPAAPQ
jgi:outer membrane lipoprotein-sorting protein